MEELTRRPKKELPRKLPRQHQWNSPASAKGPPLAETGKPHIKNIPQNFPIRFHEFLLDQMAPENRIPIRGIPIHS